MRVVVETALLIQRQRNLVVEVVQRVKKVTTELKTFGIAVKTARLQTCAVV
jgi:hypothetical protein